MNDKLMKLFFFSVFFVFLFLMIISALLMPVPNIQAQVFATNTPPPAPPSTTVDNYAIPVWVETNFLEFVFEQLQQGYENHGEFQLVSQLVLHELQQRFPNAPSQLQDQETIINILLEAPRGMVDMRAFVHPIIEAVLQNQEGQANISYEGFSISLLDIEADGNEETTEKVIYTRYPEDSETLLYEEFTFAQQNETGTYQLIPAENSYPVVPFTAETFLNHQIVDTNGNTVQELVLMLDDGKINNRIAILSLRGEQVIDLAQPEEIRIAEVRSWDLNNPEIPTPELQTIRYQLESETWGCLSEHLVTWVYQANYFRPATNSEEAVFRQQDSLACRMLNLEPIFERPWERAISLVELELANYPPTEIDYTRATLTLAMLHALTGNRSQAMDIIANHQPKDDISNTTLAEQIDLFLSMINTSDSTAVTICESLDLRFERGACNLDDVILRLLQDNPLSQSDSIVEQLEALGLPVEQTLTLTEVGFVDRLAVDFALANTNWIAFAPRGENDTYVASRIETPEGFEVVNLPFGFLEAPPRAYDALLQDNNPIQVLNILDNLVEDNPDMVLSPQTRYLKALSYDLAGNRQIARQEYFSLWTQFPQSIWGQLASKHLERRS